eukprot:Em0001g377a
MLRLAITLPLLFVQTTHQLDSVGLGCTPDVLPSMASDYFDSTQTLSEGVESNYPCNPTPPPDGENLPFILIFSTAVPAGVVLVLVILLVPTLVCIRRWRVRRNRLHLLPLEDMDGSDDSNSDDGDTTASQRDVDTRNAIPVHKISRQPVLVFAEDDDREICEQDTEHRVGFMGHHTRSKK